MERLQEILLASYGKINHMSSKESEFTITHHHDGTTTIQDSDGNFNTVPTKSLPDGRNFDPKKHPLVACALSLGGQITQTTNMPKPKHH